MTRTPRPAHPLAGAAVGLAAVGGYLVAWEYVVERPVCEDTGIFACSGPGLLMYVVGLPILYVLWSLAMTWVGASLPWLVPLVVLACFTVLAGSGVFDPPKLVWPVLSGVVCWSWMSLITARVTQGGDDVSSQHR